jgi:predicted nucleic-acid-binding protein
MLKKNLILLDTNIFIRFLTADNDKFYQKATQIFFDIENDDMHAMILESVFAEIVFVLEKVYKVSRQEIVDLLMKLLDLKGWRRTNILLYKKALNIYQERKVDIVDCLLLAFSEIQNIEVKSFDRDIIKYI